MQNLFEQSYTPNELGSISELGLAHIGDAVYELLIRSWLISQGWTTAAKLHKETVLRVSAPAQADALDRILPLLTPEEDAVYHRGRNTHLHGIPKKASPGQYARATGLEALFGWLYLQGRQTRISELFAAIMEAPDAV